MPDNFEYMILNSTARNSAQNETVGLLQAGWCSDVRAPDSAAENWTLPLAFPPPAGPAPCPPAATACCRGLPHHPSSLPREFQILHLWRMCLIAEARVTRLGPHCREIWGAVTRQHSQFLCCFVTWPPTKNLKRGKFTRMGKEFNYLLGNQKEWQMSMVTEQC